MPRWTRKFFQNLSSLYVSKTVQPTTISFKNSATSVNSNVLGYLRMSYNFHKQLQNPYQPFNFNFNHKNSDDSHSTDNHVVKFRGWSSMKQYVKNKSTKWGSKFWYCCTSETGYLYWINLHLCKKENTDENLKPGVVFKMT